MKQYVVTLSYAENAALSVVALDQQDWIDNAVHARCAAAIEHITKIVVEKCLENKIQLPGNIDDIVKLGLDKGWVITVEQNNKEIEERMALEQR